MDEDVDRCRSTAEEVLGSPVVAAWWVRPRAVATTDKFGLSTNLGDAISGAISLLFRRSTARHKGYVPRLPRLMLLATSATGAGLLEFSDVSAGRLRQVVATLERGRYSVVRPPGHDNALDLVCPGRRVLAVEFIDGTASADEALRQLR